MTKLTARVRRWFHVKGWWVRRLLRPRKHARPHYTMDRLDVTTRRNGRLIKHDATLECACGKTFWRKIIWQDRSA